MVAHDMLNQVPSTCEWEVHLGRERGQPYKQRRERHLHVGELPMLRVFFFFSSRRRHTISVSAFLLNRSSDLCVMEAIKLCRLDTPIIFIEARINLSRFVVTGCAAKTSATVTFPSLNLISLFAFCFNIWLNGVAS